MQIKNAFRWAICTSLVFINFNAETEALAGSPNLPSGSPIFLDQGNKWGMSERKDFYSIDQGSWIIPYQWIVALNQPNGLPFMRDSLSRYGYLPNAKSVKNPNGLPVGFLVAKSDLLGPQFSMTCAACHTRQITNRGFSYRIDGGPAFSDAYSFFKDLDASVGYTLANRSEFYQFQYRIQWQGMNPPSYEQVSKWYLPFHTLMTNALNQNTDPWGIGRMDALSMIQDRVDGLQIGRPAQDYIIRDNIAPANSAVRYPFIWNDAKQDFAQWAGTAVNGNYSYALQRHTLGVLGLFAFLQPQPDPSKKNGYNFLSADSINFDGLGVAETLAGRIGPPQWPFKVDASKAARGKLIYEKTCALGCHEMKQGQARPPVTDTWRTPVINAGTDTRYYDVLRRTSASSGILTGFFNPVNNSGPIPANGVVSFTLVNTVNQSILTQRYPQIDLTISAPIRPTGAYETRVLQGIWAAAPYLHNGSVQSLAELLKPAKDRVKSFQVGPEYDTDNVGIAAVQPGGASSLRVTTDCTSINSGNSNCGHEFGVWLSPAQKEDLLEYLKNL